MMSAVKWVPRSELTLKGSPNLEKMWFINRQAVVSAVSLGAGRHSIHFVNSQTTVRKYLLPRVDRQVKSSHLYLYSAFNNTNCDKATAQYQNGKIVSIM